MHIWILCNEAAGRSLSDDTLRELVLAAGHTVADLVTTSRVSRPPQRQDVDLIVAAGGDGTVATVATISARTSIPMGILPLGTANNIANSLRLGDDVQRLVTGWNHARRVPLDLGDARARAKHWVVVEGIGCGLIPAGIEAAQQALETSKAEPAVELAVAVEIFYDVLKHLEPVRRTITIDGKPISEPLLMLEILNIASVGPNLVLAPDASALDGKLDVVLAGPQHRSELLAYLESRIRNTDRRLSLPSYRACHVHIESCEMVHIDDELVDTCDLGDIDVTMQAGVATVLL